RNLLAGGPGLLKALLAKALVKYRPCRRRSPKGRSPLGQEALEPGSESVRTPSPLRGDSVPDREEGRRSQQSLLLRSKAPANARGGVPRYLRRGLRVYPLGRNTIGVCSS